VRLDRAAIFVDFDGTITDVDTFDALVRSQAGDQAWDAIERELLAGRVTLREALRREAALVRLSRPEALAFLEANARVDPTFGPFVARMRAAGAEVRVVSSGIRTVIHDALERAGVEIEVLANDVDFSTDGWTFAFVDDSANGHDKAAHVLAAQAAGAATVYVGDGISDYEAALVAERRFAKDGRRLLDYCRSRGVACTPFRTFDEIERALVRES
jgi:HAD superfamily phosphoserine phosphatase-like hydrolase